MTTDKKNNTGYYNTGSYNTDSYNTGNWNTGNYNTGDWNTGNYNTGDYNTGNHSTGNYNTGYCNTGSYNTGSYNTGDWNIGKYNTGDWNIGKYNTGDWNTGNYNTGDWNTGGYNTGNYHVGCFNTISAPKAYYFNTLIDKELWDNALKPDWIYMPALTTWVSTEDMTAKEKQKNPSYETTGGYLRVNDMKEEWRKAYDNATPEDIELTKQLPAFDAEVFLEITGIDLREPKKAGVEVREYGRV